jgi:hypothetical protein
MEDLKTFIDRRTEELMKNLGFTLQPPQKAKKETTQVSGTITFLPHSNRVSLKKKEEK